MAYLWAWIETRAMANPLIESQFYYRDMGRMLTYGSFFYAIYFVASFPIFYHLDEKQEANWTLVTTVGAAAAAGLFMLLMLDLAAMIFGPI